MKDLIKNLEVQTRREDIPSKGIHVTVSQKHYEAISRMKQRGEITSRMAYIRELIRKDFKERESR